MSSRGCFLEKYFPKDVRNKNEMEFLELKQGNMTVAEYAAKFEELVRVAYYRSIGPMKNKKNGPQHRGKPYSTLPKQYAVPTIRRLLLWGLRVVVVANPIFCPLRSLVTNVKDCPYPKKEQNGGGLNDQIGHPKATGRVFTLNGAEALKSIDLIQGKLKLSVSSLNNDLVVETPTSGSVLTSSVCLNCPLEISSRTFLIDLICFPLSQIDVILGMDWLSSNHDLLNWFDKIVVFDDSGMSKDMMFISTNQVLTSLKEDAQVYMILSNLEIETKVSICGLHVVREFPKVFPEDISGLPPEREIEFSIDLVPGAGPISIAP
ncbi:uncharacterized protein LOC114401897 [Glycine soja]|uniref:uncharacterized protein LOC114401897 n=1 Tax=Glycine soja TaxID=3848 RepID=UPI0010400A91|nr:uncharacterized protein LOC114401897 [Glycine soja]